MTSVKAQLIMHTMKVKGILLAVINGDLPTGMLILTALYLALNER